MNIVLDGKATYPSSVLALGMFDGVHIGHTVLLQTAKRIAEENHLPLVACTFAEHPLRLLDAAACPSYLQTLTERQQCMAELGVDLFFSFPFDDSLMQMPAEVYIGELYRRFHPKAIVCGYNHHFGEKGLGTPTFLHMLGHELDFQTTIIPQIGYDGEVVSATAIRDLLAKGEVEKANQWLGRPYQLRCRLQNHEITIEPQGKQTLPPGEYEAYFGGENTPIQVQLFTSEKGTYHGSLLEGTGTLTLLRRK